MTTINYTETKPVSSEMNLLMNNQGQYVLVTDLVEPASPLDYISQLDGVGFSINPKDMLFNHDGDDTLMTILTNLVKDHTDTLTTEQLFDWVNNNLMGYDDKNNKEQLKSQIINYLETGIWSSDFDDTLDYLKDSSTLKESDYKIYFLDVDEYGAHIGDKFTDSIMIVDTEQYTLDDVKDFVSQLDGYIKGFGNTFVPLVKLDKEHLINTWDSTAEIIETLGDRATYQYAKENGLHELNIKELKEIESILN